MQSFIQTILFTFALAAIKNIELSKDSLKLIQVVLRHGDRTPDLPMYPNDPHINNTFYPFGVGQLTNRGKEREFNIGRYLRNVYGKFIGNVYTPEVVYGLSSYYPRCRASLQLVLAGLFPPEEIQRWNRDLDWQPIPYDYMPENENYIFNAIGACPNFSRLLEKYLKGKTFEELYPNQKNITSFLRKHTALHEYDLPLFFVYLYATLKAEKELDLRLPDWAKEVFPQPLETLSGFSWGHMCGSDELKMISGGFLMGRILNNSISKLKEHSHLKHRKVSLYAGHDFTVAAILQVLGAYDNSNPRYGTFVIIELHDLKGDHYVRALRQNYDYGEPEEVAISGCGELCSVEKFHKIMLKYLNFSHMLEVCGK